MSYATIFPCRRTRSRSGAPHRAERPSGTRPFAAGPSVCPLPRNALSDNATTTPENARWLEANKGLRNPKEITGWKPGAR